MRDGLIAFGRKKLEQLHEGGLEHALRGGRPTSRLAVIGTGRHCRTHLLPNLPFLPVELVAICSAHLENAASCGRRYGASRYYADWAEMLTTERPDLVLCCIGAAEHPAVIRRALDLGLPLFVEKPAAESSEQLASLAAHPDSGRVMVGFQKRFAPNYRFLKAALERRRHGRLRCLQLELGVGAFAGGLRTFLLEVGIHCVDLLRFFVPEARIVGVQKRDAGGGRLNVLVSFCGSDDVVGNLLLSSNFDWRSCHERVLAVCDRLHVAVENLVDLRITPSSRSLAGLPLEQVTRRRVYGRHWRPGWVSGTPEDSSLAQTGFLHELRAFVDMAQGRGSQRLSDLDNALRTHRMLEEIERA